jgi:hypothetical protein
MLPPRHQAADVASSWAISQPSASGAIAEAAVTGVPSSKRNVLTSSTTTRTCRLCPGGRQLTPRRRRTCRDAHPPLRSAP